MYKPKKGISKKMLGLGVAAGFVGGAALGVAGTMASYSVMHRYHVIINTCLLGHILDMRSKCLRILFHDSNNLLPSLHPFPDMNSLI